MTDQDASADEAAMPKDEGHSDDLINEADGIDDDYIQDDIQNQNVSTAQVPLIWRILAIVIAAVIIGVVLVPWLNRRSDSSPTTASLDTASEVIESEASNTDATTVEVPDASPEALFELGQTHYHAGEWDQAIAVYQKVIELDSSYQSAYVNLGDAYYQRGQLDLAVQSYKQAILIVPDDAEVAYNLGAAYLQQAISGGQLNEAGVAEAIAQIEQAIELDPELPHPYYALGAAYQLSGQPDLAIENFERFLELDDGSDSRATTEAQRILAELKAATGQ